MPKITEGRYALGALTIFAAWLFIGLPLLYQPTHDAPRVHPKQQSENRIHDQGAGQPPPSRPKGGNEEQHTGEEGTEFWPPLFGYRLKITDTLIALFTAGLFIATWWLYGATRKLVLGAEQTAERQLRAYVFAEAEAITKANVWHYVIKFKNWGQTPAYDFSQYTDAGVFDEPVPEEKFILSRDEFYSVAPLPPGQTVNTANVYAVSGTEAAEIKAGSKSFYVYGEIVYRDAFRRKRMVRFRFVHNRDTGGNALMYCQHGNDES